MAKVVEEAEIIIETSRKKHRIDWIDWIKAIGIFLVVIGHANPNPKLRLWIYSFHMPLFFILSGATFNPNKYNNLKEFTKARVRSLIIPYVCINVFTIIFYYIYYNYLIKSGFNMIACIKAILIGNAEIAYPFHGPTWFLLTLFLSEVLFYCLSKICKYDKKDLFILTILFILVGYAESIGGGINMPWHINTVPMATGLMIAGYLIYGYIIANEEKVRHINILIPIIFMCIGGYISIFANKNVSMNINKYNSLVLTLSAIFFSMAGITIILMKIRKSNLLSFVGRNSLIILAVHRPVIFLAEYYFPKFKNDSWKSTLIATIMFICLLPITYLIERYMPFLVGNLKRYSKTGKRVIYSILIIIVIVFMGVYMIGQIDLIKYKSFIKKQDYVAHALGGIDGFAYTDSKEALENSYNNGFRLFEVDVKLTSDEKLVCVHGWSKSDYEKRLGWEYNEDNAVMDYDTFMSSKIRGQYTTMSFKDLAEFIEENNDIYIMIDIGSKSYEETKKIYTKIVEDCNNNSKILQRLIVGGHTKSMIKAVKECYNFKLINLYWANDDKREESIKTKEKFVKYCKNNGISSLSISTDNYTDEFGEYMKKNNMIVYVFTENDEDKATQILQNADLVGTDFIEISK